MAGNGRLSESSDMRGSRNSIRTQPRMEAHGASTDHVEKLPGAFSFRRCELQPARIPHCISPTHPHLFRLFSPLHSVEFGSHTHSLPHNAARFRIPGAVVGPQPELQAPGDELQPAAAALFPQGTPTDIVHSSHAYMDSADHPHRSSSSA